MIKPLTQKDRPSFCFAVTKLYYKTARIPSIGEFVALRGLKIDDDKKIIYACERIDGNLIQASEDELDRFVL